jgi:hypothetical protein
MFIPDLDGFGQFVQVATGVFAPQSRPRRLWKGRGTIGGGIIRNI